MFELFVPLKVAIFGLARSLCMESGPVTKKPQSRPARDHVTHQMTHVIGGCSSSGGERKTIKSPILPYNKWEPPPSADVATPGEEGRKQSDNSPITPRRLVSSHRTTRDLNRQQSAASSIAQVSRWSTNRRFLACFDSYSTYFYYYRFFLTAICVWIMRSSRIADKWFDLLTLHLLPKAKPGQMTISANRPLHGGVSAGNQGVMGPHPQQSYYSLVISNYKYWVMCWTDIKLRTNNHSSELSFDVMCNYLSPTFRDSTLEIGQF